LARQVRLLQKPTLEQLSLKLKINDSHINQTVLGLLAQESAFRIALTIALAMLRVSRLRSIAQQLHKLNRQALHQTTKLERRWQQQQQQRLLLNYVYFVANIIVIVAQTATQT
jgi:hypothetical protein